MKEIILQVKSDFGVGFLTGFMFAAVVAFVVTR
jgi:hypothetical protein